MDSSLSSASLMLALISGLVALAVALRSVGESSMSSKMEEMIVSDGDGSISSDSTSIISSVLESDGKSSAMSDMKAVVFDNGAVLVLVLMLLKAFIEKASAKSTLLDARRVVVVAPMMSDSDCLLNIV